MRDHRRNRPGVSLPEVLVAAVLLAVGVAGCLSALSTAVRFRAAAIARERVASAAGGRLSWFAAASCPVADTVLTSAAGARVSEYWVVTRQPAAIHLAGEARVDGAGRTHRLALDTRLPCD